MYFYQTANSGLCSNLFSDGDTSHIACPPPCPHQGEQIQQLILWATTARVLFLTIGTIASEGKLRAKIFHSSKNIHKIASFFRSFFLLENFNFICFAVATFMSNLIVPFIQYSN